MKTYVVIADKQDVLAHIAFREWLAPRGILITNYQMARENQTMKKAYSLASYVDQIGKGNDLIDYMKMVQRLNESPEQQDYDLTTYRDRAVQINPINYLRNGAFWNTPFFRAWVNTQIPEHREKYTLLADKLNKNRIPDPFHFFMHFFASLITREYGVFGVGDRLSFGQKAGQPFAGF